MDILPTDSRSFRKLRELTLEEILKIDNVFEAYLKVKKKNKGPGLNGVSLKDIEGEELNFIARIINALKKESYIPRIVKLVSIPKKNGGERKIGVLSIEDKIIQQAILNILNPIYEDLFSFYSFAYRKNKSYINAVEVVEFFLKKDYEYILDLDIEDFFNTIDLDILRKLLRVKIKDKKLLKLLDKYLNQNIYDNGKVYKMKCGIIQGNILSPLFSNIYLHNLDIIANLNSGKMIRYADDFLILVKEKKDIKRYLSIVEKYFKEYNLRLNYKKSKIINFKQVKKIRFLGQIIYKSW
ncbi:group II intron reverse transcriptase/maturase [Cetobacterium ceti]|uniref:Group II intron reverse transcriptase/maturase n=1 Tax=Cetobacterium ceti TaxID=180163 RepID=A0A1T4K562_9FUSO|nr:reverse transcriptase domain-containing protein [Cetobacterium ceti]SJZ37455.1 group II intron reverse transcriptase/maturase [Cetobacterium ceti]